MKKTKKLSLADFMNSSLANEKEALNAITGGILGACHDSVQGKVKGALCFINYKP